MVITENGKCPHYDRLGELFADEARYRYTAVKLDILMNESDTPNLEARIQERLSGSDVPDFNEVFRRLRGLAFSYVGDCASGTSGMQEQDFQDMAYVSAYKALGSVGSGFGQIVEGAQSGFYSWLRAIVKRQYVDYIRKRAGSLHNPVSLNAIQNSEYLNGDSCGIDSLFSEFGACFGNPERLVVNKMMAQEIRTIIGQFSEPRQSIFMMSCYGEMSNKNIADALEISPGSVGVELHRGRNIIYQHLLDRDYIESVA